MDWQEYDALSMLHLCPQSQQYDGFTPGQRVPGRTPKMPIGVTGDPSPCDFMNPADTPVAPTHQVRVELREMQQASLKIGFGGKFNMTLNQRVREMESEEFFL